MAIMVIVDATGTAGMFLKAAKAADRALKHTPRTIS
jgi:hypothetical protein